MATEKNQEPDADGYVSTGIYSQFQGTKAEHPEEFEKNQDLGLRSLLWSTEELLSKLQQGFQEIKDDRKQETSAELWSDDAIIRESFAGESLVHLAREMIDELPEIPQQLVHYLVQIGELKERVQVRMYEHFVASEQLRREGAANGGRNSAKLTDFEWCKIRKFIEKRTLEKISAAEACREAHAQLKAGIFPEIQRIDISASALQTRWTNRNKSSNQ